MIIKKLSKNGFLTSEGWFTVDMNRYMRKPESLFYSLKIGDNVEILKQNIVKDKSYVTEFKLIAVSDVGAVSGTRDLRAIVGDKVEARVPATNSTRSVEGKASPLSSLKALNGEHPQLSFPLRDAEILRGQTLNIIAANLTAKGYNFLDASARSELVELSLTLFEEVSLKWRNG